MEARTKMIISRVILVLVAVFFVGSYFYQKNLDEKQQAQQKEEQQEQKEQMEKEEDPSDNEKPEEKGTDLDLTAPYKDDGKKLSDFYSPEDLEASKKVADAFVRALYPVDGNNIQKGTKDAAAYATQNMAAMMTSGDANFIRPTDDFFSRSIKDVTVQEPEDITSDAIMWKVTATGEIKNKKGEVTDQDKTDYLLQFQKENNEFKVSEFTLDPN